MKKSTKVLIISLVLLIVAALVVASVLYRKNLLEKYDYEANPSDNADILEEKDSSETDKNQTLSPAGDDPLIVEEPEDTVGEKEYECPDELKKAIENNPDIYAWLTVTDADISYPICNRPDDNGFYLNHSSSAKWDPMGALFTEDYNKRDFSDSAVVVYGHSMTGKKYFGTLQKNYSSKDFFEEHREIKIYLEDRELTYRIFAAVPFTNEHLLYYYDFSQEVFFNAFIRSVVGVRTLDSIIDKDNIPEYGTQLLILSTCLKSYNNKRFLVIASVCNEE